MHGAMETVQLAMYLCGSCSEAQRAEVEAWVREDPARRELLDELRRIYRGTGKTAEQRARDARRQHRMWARIRAHIDRQDERSRRDR